MPATQMVKVSVPEVDIPSERLMRILLIEDDPEGGSELAEWLESFGFWVDGVETLTEAVKLLEVNEYQAVIADNLLKAPDVRGEEFLLANVSLMGRARRVLITAYGLDIIKNYPELVDKGIPVLEKGTDAYLQDLRRITLEQFEDAKRAIERRIRDAVQSVTAEAGENVRHLALRTGTTEPSIQAARIESPPQGMKKPSEPLHDSASLQARVRFLESELQGDKSYSQLYKLGAGTFFVAVLSLAFWKITGIGAPFHPIFALIAGLAGLGVMAMAFLVRRGEHKDIAK